MRKPRIIPAFRDSLEHEQQHEHWKAALKNAVRSPEVLLNRLGLDPSGVDLAPDFPVRVPEPYLARMRPNDPKDPLLRQVLSLEEERMDAPGYRTDALEEADATRAPGLLQKYAGRCLLITTPACAVHCRYCFRRHFPYADHEPGHHAAALTEIEADTSLSEVILSGGDPLVMEDTPLERVLDRLDAMPHIRRIRLHTRLPIVIPQRVTEHLLNALRGLKSRVVMVVHCNHARELDATTLQAFERLHSAGVTLLNQAVVLRGVNDSISAQVALAEALHEQRVLPYYLHLPDRVVGTQHFDVEASEAQRLMRDVHAQLPGYLVPRLVREIPGQTGKSPIYWTTERTNPL